MKLKEYLRNKPLDEHFDLIPDMHISRNLHDYDEWEITNIETFSGRKRIYIEEKRISNG